MDKEILKYILDHDEELVLATILKTKGSGPRHKGSKMLINNAGVVLGTIGGGQGEGKVILKSKEVIKSKESVIFEVSMLGDSISEEIMICGGENTVFIEYINDKKIFNEYMEIIKRGASATYGIDGRTLKRVDHLKGDYSDSFIPRDKLLILGGGYVGKAVYDFAIALNFEITIFDDREEFGNKDRFPKAKRAESGDYKKLIESYSFTQDTYVVTVTRGHIADYLALETIIDKKYKYLGCIGSSRKLALVKEGLLAAGKDRDKIDNLYAPIGFNIGAETPEEIAIAILGEIIEVKNGK